MIGDCACPRPKGSKTMALPNIEVDGESCEKNPAQKAG